MQNRPLHQEVKLESRPTLQFCQFIESIINEVKVPIQRECCFFSDGLSGVRANYQRLVGAYAGVKKMIYKYESLREPLEMSQDLREILDKANQDIKMLEAEIAKSENELDEGRSELEAQKKMIKEKMEQRMMQAQLEKNGLEEQRKKINEAMAHKNFFQKMKMRKSKKELKTVKTKIKTMDADAELQKIETDLREAEAKLQHHIESFSDKIRIYKIKLQAAREKVDNVTLRFERRKTEYNATVSKEMMEGLQLINDHLINFFDQVEKLKVDNKGSKKLAFKIERLNKIAAVNRGKSHQLLSGLMCPDYPKQDHYQRESDEVVLDQDEKSILISQGQTFFSILSTNVSPDAPDALQASMKMAGK